MAQNAYCNECGARVRLADTGLCVMGHPRSALRDVREGEPEPATARAQTPGPSAGGASTPNPTRAESTASGVIGKLVVIVPAVLVIFVGLYTGYAAGVQMGQSKSEAWLSSIAGMLLTGLIVALLVWDRRRKMGR